MRVVHQCSLLYTILLPSFDHSGQPGTAAFPGRQDGLRYPVLPNHTRNVICYKICSNVTFRCPHGGLGDEYGTR
jgi:hypothetical protein